MLRYFTFLRPLSGFSSHFCNTHFRDTLFSSLPLFSNYSTGFRICESSKYHSKQFFYSSFTLFSKIRKLTVFSRNPRTPIIPQSVRLRRSADGSFVPKNRLSCRCPAARPVRPARNFPETKKNHMPGARGACRAYDGGFGSIFPWELLPPLRRSPSLEEGGLWGREAEVGRMSAGAQCAPLQRCGNCNCEMRLQRWVASLQPSVAPPSPVGARIARSFISDVITTFREDARRVIGATAKPLYSIDGKAVSLDRRNPQTSLIEGGGPPAGGRRSRRAPLGLGD